MQDSSVERCPLSVICPIVFVPEIMGSRLRKNVDRRVVWEPGVEDWDSIWHSLNLAAAGPQEKRRMVVGKPDQYFSSSYLEVALSENDDDRYSGLLPSYLPFINWLNRQALYQMLADSSRGAGVRLWFLKNRSWR